MSFFDQQDMAEIQHPSFPGERLIACLNPLLAEEQSSVSVMNYWGATEKQLNKSGNLLSKSKNHCAAAERSAWPWAAF